MSWRRAERGRVEPSPRGARRWLRFGQAGLWWAAICLAIWTSPAAAQGKPTAGYPEPIVQWGVQQGETCADIAKAMYGSAEHVPLLLRYNRIVCLRGAPLREGLTLVLPAKVTKVPTARITSVNPQVRARPPGGGWGTAGAGMPLSTNANVHSMETGRAGIRFVDRSRVYLASNTLVVIYGTASQTAVSKVPPPAVELNEGELQAGLAALRGDTVEVSVKGGGRVSAASRDTVVARKGKRTRVAVFDGSAGVRSGGRAVTVPQNHGTDFRQGQAPKKPRPLPPAPQWSDGGSAQVVLAPAGQGRLEAAWKPVPRARAYRLEVSRQADFQALEVREEVGADVLAFRGEQLPAGRYHLRVRAIDDEEYLGIASATRTVEIVEATVKSGAGSVGQDRVQVSPYGVLALSPSNRLELALDDGPFGPMLPEIDLQRLAPRKIRLRPRGSTAEQVTVVEYVEVAATVTARADDQAQTLSVQVALRGLEGIDVAARVAPTLRIHWPDGVQTAQLTATTTGGYGAVLPMKDDVEGLRLDVVDRRGKLLGTGSYGDESAAPVPGEGDRGDEPELISPLGPSFTIIALSRHANVVWFSPTAPTAATVGTAIGLEPDDELAVHGQAAASGSIGPVGIEALLRTGSSPGDATADTSAWLGARWRIHRFDAGDLELGPGLRLGLPVSKSSPPAQLEPAFALGGRIDRWSLLGNAGARVRLHESAERSAVDPVQAFLLFGTVVDILPILRAQALLDGHLLIDDELDGTGGLGLGLELGKTLYGGIGARLSPFGDREGIFSAQLTLGIREQ